MAAIRAVILGIGTVSVMTNFIEKLRNALRDIRMFLTRSDLAGWSVGYAFDCCTNVLGYAVDKAYYITCVRPKDVVVGFCDEIANWIAFSE
jgi:hypothetical protein